jgi:hypothetical protein
LVDNKSDKLLEKDLTACDEDCGHMGVLRKLLGKAMGICQIQDTDGKW